MPIYEYSCKKCETKFEKLVRSITQRDEVPCPKCGSTQTTRDFSVFAVGSEPVKSAPGMCGRCGGPGPCAMGD